MKLFASSLTGDAKVWIDGRPKGSIKSIEELQKAFKVRWCDKEHSQDLFSQYSNICKDLVRIQEISLIGSILYLKRSGQRLAQNKLSSVITYPP